MTVFFNFILALLFYIVCLLVVGVAVYCIFRLAEKIDIPHDEDFEKP